VNGFCNGAVELGKQKAEGGGSRRFLACPLQQRHTTLLRLEARADQTMFVTNVASGRIVSTEVKSIEALQGRGDMLLEIVSTGRVAAEFVLGVTNCTLGFVAGPAVRTSLEPYATRKHQIALHASQTKGGDAHCTATLYDALGAVLESKHVHFNVTDLQESKGAQVPVEREGEEATGEDPTGSDCATLCPSMIDAHAVLLQAVGNVVSHDCSFGHGLVLLLRGCLARCSLQDDELLLQGLLSSWRFLVFDKKQQSPHHCREHKAEQLSFQAARHGLSQHRELRHDSFARLNSSAT